MRHRFMLTIWHVLTVFILVCTLVFAGLISYWSLEGMNPVIEFPKGLVVQDKAVYSGDDITIHAPYCKNEETDFTQITRSLSDQIVYYLPPLTNNVPKGCVDFTGHVTIPANLPSDTYTYTMTFTFKLNPIKTVNYTFTTNQFKVTRKEFKL